MLKRILSVVVSLSVIAGLAAGCGTKETVTADTSTQTAAASTTVEKPAEKVTIRYSNWMSKGEQTPTLKKFMEENPNIIVQEEILDGTNYDKIQKARFMSGDADDVVYLKGASFDEYVKQGWLLDVTDQAGTQQMKSNDVLYNVFLKDGKAFGAIVDGSIQCHPFYYNKVYFDKLGLKVPTTIEEFYALCEKIKADGKDPMVFGGADAWTISGVFTEPYRFTENLRNFENMDDAIAEGKLGWADSYKAGFEFLENSLKKGYISKAALTLKYDQSVQYFVDGKAAMIPQGPWLPTLEAVTKADPAAFELGAFLFPFTKDSNGKLHVLASVTGAIAINSESKNIDAAKKLYNFILSPENLKSLVESQGADTFMPGVTVEKDPILKDYYTTLYDTSIAIQHFGRGKYTFPSGLNTTANSAAQAILSGSSTKEQLDLMIKEYEKVKDQVVLK